MDGINIRRHLIQVASQCRFKLDTNNSDKSSKYLEYRHKGKLQMSIIRISNHCTNASTWKMHYGSNKAQIQLSKKEERRYKGNYNGLSKKYFNKRFYSIVIFDPQIDGEQNCGDITENGINVIQRAYSSTQLTEEQIIALEDFIKRIGSDGVKENKQYITMNNTKKRIRLTESQLHNIIKEAINELHKSAYTGRTTPYHYHNKTAAQCLADKAREQENYNEYDTPDDPRNEINDEEWAYDHPQCRPADKLKHQTVIPTFDGDSAHGRNPFSESIHRAIRKVLR